MLDNIAKPRNRLLLGLVLGLVIILGLASRKFGVQLPSFLASNAGDALWTVAVYLALALVVPRCSPIKLGLIAFGISLAVELSQLVDVAWFNAIRKTLPGRLLLGSGFLWIDLLRYFFGALLATAVDSLCQARKRG